MQCKGAHLCTAVRWPSLRESCGTTPRSTPPFSPPAAAAAGAGCVVGCCLHGCDCPPGWCWEPRGGWRGARGRLPLGAFPLTCCGTWWPPGWDGCGRFSLPHPCPLPPDCAADGIPAWAEGEGSSLPAAAPRLPKKPGWASWLDAGQGDRGFAAAWREPTHSSSSQLTHQPGCTALSTHRRSQGTFEASSAGKIPEMCWTAQ